MTSAVFLHIKKSDPNVCKLHLKNKKLCLKALGSAEYGGKIKRQANSKRYASFKKKIQQAYSQHVVTPEHNTPSISYSLSLSGSLFPPLPFQSCHS